MNLMVIAARIASTDSCIYVDLDETLIHTFLLTPETAPSFLTYSGEKLQVDQYGTVLRPGAHEFLASLRALNVGPIYLLTHSVSEYAETMVAAFGLDVDAIYPRESLSGQVGNGEKRFALVDDLDPSHFVFQLKAHAMGIPQPEGELKEDVAKAYYSAWHIQPTAFMGDPNDSGLTGLADVVALYFG